MSNNIDRASEWFTNRVNEWRNPHIEMFRGTATLVSRTAHVSGNQHGVGTAQVVTCEVGGRPVEIWMPSIPMIENGDEVIVAGKIKFGKLEAWAYRNMRNGTSGHWNYNIGAGCACIGMLFMFLLISLLAPVMIILPLIFIPLFIWFAWEKYRVYRAFNMILAQPNTTLS